MSRSPLVPIFITVFVDVLGLTIVLPLLPYYALHFGATALIATLLTSSYAVCQLVSGPLLGRISDRTGRKPTLLASQIGTFIAFLVLARAEPLARSIEHLIGGDWQHIALGMLFVGRMIDGSTAGNLTIAQAYISDVTKPENRTSAFALIGIAFGGGFVIGPAISGFLAHRFGYASPFYMAATLSALSITFTTTLLPNIKPKPIDRNKVSGFRSFFEQPLPRQRLLQLLFFYLSFSSLIAGLALFLKAQLDFDAESTGWIYAFSGVVGGTVQGGVIKRLVARFGEERLTRFGFVFMAFGVGLIGAAFKLPVLLPLVAISSLGMAIVRPCLTTLLTRSVSENDQGAVLGTSQSLASIAQIIAPPTVGFFIDRGWLPLYGAIAALYACIGAVLTMSSPAPAVDSPT